MDSCIIRYVNVKKSFKEVSPCQGLFLDIPKGKVTAILGPSGCGKTVALKMLVGLITPDDGNIFFDNKDLALLNTDEEFLPIRRRISMVFQGAALFDSMNVFDNIAYPLKIDEKLDVQDGDIKDVVYRSLMMVGLSNVHEKMPSELSGGMKKRVGLARAIVTNPEVILYDEPTAGLDPINTRRIVDLILELESRLKCTSIVVSHDMPALEKMAYKAAFFYMGKARQSGTFSDLKNSEDSLIRGFINGDPSTSLTVMQD